MHAQAVRLAGNVEPQKPGILGTAEADPAIGQPYDERGRGQVGMIVDRHDPTG
ncbi:hypothetical protein [Alteriqipengyuania lutimaris]|uniref:hypothetical protein n=1 Tax=Alteriqipengyuania lutimaris TaxID=1538146 RepID=UPI001CFC6726|nr:hypothetical protein [Alteriqipengyuania lutimaris]